MQTIGKCKLCHCEKPLLNESHIIPDFMYKGLFDKGHRLNKFAPAEFIKGNKRVSRPPTGEYECGILCATCDNEIIGGYETYARKALYGKVEEYSSDLPECANFKTTSGVTFTHGKNVHYKEFKLFLLSILWKASISSRPFFKEVNLGPYEETIRKMILSGDAKDEETFPIVIMTWLNDKSSSSDVVAQPGINKKEKGVRYIFPIAGVTYVFHISPSSLNPDLREFILSSKDEAYFLHMPKGQALKLLLTYSGAKI
jgi:hypothetical protein